MFGKDCRVLVLTTVGDYQDTPPRRSSRFWRQHETNGTSLEWICNRMMHNTPISLTQVPVPLPGPATRCGEERS